MAKTLQEITGSKAVTIRPFRFQNSKGDWRWVETTVSNHLENPAIRGYVVNSRDITEKKQNDDELKKLSLVAQESHSPMLITNLSNEITWVNNALLQLCEFSFEEIIGKRPQEVFITGEMDVATHQQVQKDLQAGKTTTREERFFSRSGKEYWLYLAIQPIYNDQKEMEYFLAIGNDITERKKAEQARMQAEQRFQALVQNGSDLIVVIDQKGTFHYVSDNVTAVLEYTPEEVVGQSAFELIHPEDVQKVSIELSSLLTGGANGKSVHHRFLHNDGSWVWLESKGVDHQDNPFINGILVNARNITDRVLLHQRLEEEVHNKQKEIMAAVIKAQETERSQLGLELHDNVNQVLTTVKLYNEMYLSGYVQDQNLLVKSAQYTQDCINEIRSISKRLSMPTLGKITLQDSITELIESINLTKRLEITFMHQDIDQCPISDDLHLAIYRIVQEGLNNILKYAQAKQAHIVIKRKKNELLVMIADNGKGFDTRTKRKGIGITNIKTRAENLNASFRITSAPGKGCKIEISFPVVS